MGATVPAQGGAEISGGASAPEGMSPLPPSLLRTCALGRPVADARTRPRSQSRGAAAAVSRPVLGPFS